MTTLFQAEDSLKDQNNVVANEPKCSTFEMQVL